MDTGLLQPESIMKYNKGNLRKSLPFLEGGLLPMS